MSGMSEIDTKPFESVQASLSLFGEKNESRKHRQTSSPQSELEKEIDSLQKELSNYKVHVEIQDSEHTQVILKLEHYQKMAGELSTALKRCQFERDNYLGECREATHRIYELELQMTDVADQLSGATEIKDQLLFAQKQLEDMGKQIEIMKDLENQILAKSIFIDSLQSELKLAHELSSSSAEDDSLEELEALKGDLEIKERKNQEQQTYIEMLEAELDHLRKELKLATEEAGQLRCNIENLATQLEEAGAEMNEVERRENEAEVELATLKAELHKGRSKIAAAEAAEIRASSIQSGLYLAVQELAAEAEEAKKESRRLKEEASQVIEEADGLVATDSQLQLPTEDEETDRANKSLVGNDRINITISIAEYDSLLEKAEKVDHSPPLSSQQENSIATSSDDTNELEQMKKELEAATAKIGEFRTRAEQAATRAESAERAKLLLEGQLRQWREQRQRKKAALAALKEETAAHAKVNYPPPYRYDQPSANYQPLGKVLNMKF